MCIQTTTTNCTSCRKVLDMRCGSELWTSAKAELWQPHQHSDRDCQPYCFGCFEYVGATSVILTNCIKCRAIQHVTAMYKQKVLLSKCCQGCGEILCNEHLSRSGNGCCSKCKKLPNYYLDYMPYSPTCSAKFFQSFF